MPFLCDSVRDIFSRRALYFSLLNVMQKNLNITKSSGARYRFVISVVSLYPVMVPRNLKLVRYIAQLDIAVFVISSSFDILPPLLSINVALEQTVR